MRKIVEIEDADTGTVRLRRSVDKARRDGPGHGVHEDDAGEEVSTPAVCPNGHDSQASDYCDTCGADLL